ncbi:DDE-type integrase/transposase/recombinase [Aeromonas hydrophila]|uniref:DDE-type integrase/transposase/recombinase n=1 Tax=Aeromonas hydrophila TaxID=644 RepID=UPI003BF55949
MTYGLSYAVHNRWLNFAAALDRHSRLVVGWAMSGRTDADLAVKVLNMEYRQRGCPSDVLFHPDQGSQYGISTTAVALSHAQEH